MAEPLAGSAINFFSLSDECRQDMSMDSVELLLLRFEVLAISARLRRLGDIHAADLAEFWATSSDFQEQIGGFNPAPAMPSSTVGGFSVEPVSARCEAGVADL